MQLPYATFQAIAADGTASAAVECAINVAESSRVPYELECLQSYEELLSVLEWLGFRKKVFALSVSLSCASISADSQLCWR